MNPIVFEDLVACSVFDKLPKETQGILKSLMLVSVETTSARGFMASKRAASKVISVDMPTTVPKSLKSPRLKPTLETEGSRMKKDKLKVIQLVCELRRKHQKKEKPTTHEKGKVVNLEFNKGAK